MTEFFPHVTFPDNKRDEKSVDEQINPADIRLAAMNLLARREHSLLELRNKLKRRFGDELLIEEQLLRLTNEHLQSDIRFAASYARQRVSRGYGPLRLCEELRERGVAKADVAAAMEELEVDWCAHASAVLHRKFGDLEPVDATEKSRRARFMQYRGFSADHYKHLLYS